VLSRDVVASDPRTRRAPATRAATGSGGPRNLLGYQPALDGLRGLALIAIFCFHAGFSFAPGAFLSVSTFFTLSGFLITVLLIGEHRASGRIDLKAFWSRRFRRLLPASLVVILAVLVVSWFLADASQLHRLPGDAIACLAYVANWHFIAAGDSYAALFTSKSPFQHFWSLAIEEQFYFVYPIAMVVIFRVARGKLRTVAIGLGALIALSVIESIYGWRHGWGVDRLYFGADVRAAELLVGALVGVWWVHEQRTGTASARLRAAGRLGLPALVAMLLLWRFAQRTDGVWYDGGLAAYATLTSLVVLAAVRPDGVIRKILGFRPLTALGIISYGAYLIHWPVFVFVDHARTGLAMWPLFVLRIAITIVLAVVSFYAIEQPVRLKRVATPKLRLATPVALVLVVSIGFGIAQHAPTPATDLTASRALYERQQASRDAAPVDPNGAPEIALYGDSTALMLSLGIGAHPSILREVSGFADLGCGLLEIPRRVDGVEQRYENSCKNWPARWTTASIRAASKGVDTSVIVVGPWEVADGELPGTSKWVSIGNPEYDAAEKAALTKGVDVLLKHSRRVLILDSPYIQRGRVDGSAPDSPSTQSSHARMDGWNKIAADVAASRPNVEFAYYGEYFNAHPRDDDRLRPDGIHLTWATAIDVSSWLAPELAKTIARMRAAGTASTGGP
jgi:peptidoglycan/LPS O-acetylase OafA/YrhL